VLVQVVEVAPLLLLLPLLLSCCLHQRSEPLQLEVVKALLLLLLLLPQLLLRSLHQQLEHLQLKRHCGQQQLLLPA
jgi:hypothetical protein